MASGMVFVTGGSGTLGRALLPALVAGGYSVRAMARSQAAVETVTSLGAAAASCDLVDATVLRDAITGCDLVVHAASRFREGGGPKAYRRDNVDGTNNVLEAARAAGVRRFVFIGAAGCLAGGRPVVGADESWPLQKVKYSDYFRTKSLADRAVLAASAPGFETCSLRPGMMWGGEHDPLLDAIADATRERKMVFIDGGRHPIVTSHIDNIVAAIMLALEHGHGGEAYYVFDDGSVTLREFLTRLLETRHLEAPNRSIPFRVAWPMATALELAWTVLRRPGSPPVNRELVRLNGAPFVVSDEKARRELSYRPAVTREAGLERLMARLK